MKSNFISFTNAAMLWMLIAASFSINLPVAFGSLSLVLFLILWIVSADYSTKFRSILNNPGSMIALVFLIFYALGATYSSGSLHDSFHYFTKYAKLLVIPLAVSAFTSGRYRNYAINAFLISLIGYLVISYLNWFGFFSFPVMRHGTYMALGLYFMLRNAKRKVGQFRTVWVVLSALTTFNILFIADVRTGVVTMFALLLLYAVENWRGRGMLYWFCFLLIILFVYKSAPETPNLRILNMDKELATKISSAGARFEMYSHTLTLIKRHPFFGGGTGSIESEYAELIKGEQDVYIKKVTNPHNQYLMTTQELGIVGLLVLITFFGIHWKQSYKLEQEGHGYLLRALVISTSVGSLFNSLLLDSGDGRMYCILAGILLSSYKSKSYIESIKS